MFIYIKNYITDTVVDYFCIIALTYGLIFILFGFGCFRVWMFRFRVEMCCVWVGFRLDFKQNVRVWVRCNPNRAGLWSIHISSERLLCITFPTCENIKILFHFIFNTVVQYLVFLLHLQVSILCDSASSNPPSVLHWWRNGEVISAFDSESSDAIYGGKSTHSRIDLTTSGKDDEAIFTCQATNHVLQRSVHESVTLRLLCKHHNSCINKFLRVLIFNYYENI